MSQSSAYTAYKVCILKTCHIRQQISCLPHAVQKKEDPDTVCGFYRAEVEGFGGRVYYVLAFPRDAQGRRIKADKNLKGRNNRADYYRLVRPCTGFNSKDMPKQGVWCISAAVSICYAVCSHAKIRHIHKQCDSLLLVSTKYPCCAISLMQLCSSAVSALYSVLALVRCALPNLIGHGLQSSATSTPRCPTPAV